jgi:hypothetical protein
MGTGISDNFIGSAKNICANKIVTYCVTAPVYVCKRAPKPDICVNTLLRRPVSIAFCKLAQKMQYKTMYMYNRQPERTDNPISVWMEHWPAEVKRNTKMVDGRS